MASDQLRNTPTRTLSMAKTLSYQLDCKRGFWAAAHLNTGHVFKHSLQSPKGASSFILYIEALSNPQLPFVFCTGLEAVVQCTDFLIFGNQPYQEGGFSIRGCFVLVKRTHFSSHLKTNFLKSHSYPIFCVCKREETGLELHHSCGLRNLFHTMQTVSGTGIFGEGGKGQSKKDREIRKQIILQVRRNG